MLALALGTASEARAQDTHRLSFPEDASEIHRWAYPITAALWPATLVLDRELDRRLSAEPHLSGPMFLDEPVRRLLRASDEGERQLAADLSDWLLAAQFVWPFVDSVGVVGLGDNNLHVAWQLSMIQTETIAADHIISTLLKTLFRRQRPHGQRCVERGYAAQHPERCGRRGRMRSLYSGHASAAFNLAGTQCMIRAHVPVYGHEIADGLACGLALANASMIGLLRIIADRHYATDVLLGMAMGLATGLTLPYLLHFGNDPRPAEMTGAGVEGLGAGAVPIFVFGGEL